MRLINTHTLKLGEYFEGRIPPYAILSHTWEDDEVTLQDWKEVTLEDQTARGEAIALKKGYRKISEMCELARSDGYDHVWADTNCIDKTSSAELTEATNSMFMWYRQAQVCYAYLFDVEVSGSGDDVKERIRGSRWFTWGWTLQELLAPLEVRFYSMEWEFLGTKVSMCQEIANITNIAPHYLSERSIGQRYCANQSSMVIAYEVAYAAPLHKASVAERFSWLARRKTTRSEDIAYCMFGIFGINMPLLYGEGTRAFQRLQEEIIKGTDDQSIFCWTWDLDSTSNLGSGFLANLPVEFELAGGRYIPRPSGDIGRPSPYSMTNSGLHIWTSILMGWASYLAILDVYDSAYEPMPGLGIHIGGNIETGRVFRKQFPLVPVALAVLHPHPEYDTVSSSTGSSWGERRELFVSSRHWEHPRSMLERLPGPSHFQAPLLPNPEGDGEEKIGRWEGELATYALMTFEPRHHFTSILTFPLDRFSWQQSSIEILSRLTSEERFMLRPNNPWWNEKGFNSYWLEADRHSDNGSTLLKRAFRAHRGHRVCEAVLIRCGSSSGKMQDFVLGMSGSTTQYAHQLGDLEMHFKRLSPRSLEDAHHAFSSIENMHPAEYSSEVVSRQIIFESEIRPLLRGEIMGYVHAWLAGDGSIDDIGHTHAFRALCSSCYSWHDYRTVLTHVHLILNGNSGNSN